MGKFQANSLTNIQEGSVFASPPSPWILSPGVDAVQTPHTARSPPTAQFRACWHQGSSKLSPKAKIKRNSVSHCRERGLTIREEK